MTDEKKITKGLDKELMQLIDAEMNDPVIGKLLNRNAAYVLGKEIKVLFIDRACKWLDCYIDNYLFIDAGNNAGIRWDDFINDFRKAMKGE